jgi:hypothetical protein
MRALARYLQNLEDTKFFQNPQAKVFVLVGGNGSQEYQKDRSKVLLVELDPSSKIFELEFNIIRPLNPCVSILYDDIALLENFSNLTPIVEVVAAPYFSAAQERQTLAGH